MYFDKKICGKAILMWSIIDKLLQGLFTPDSLKKTSLLFNLLKKEERTFTGEFFLAL